MAWIWSLIGGLIVATGVLACYMRQRDVGQSLCFVLGLWVASGMGFVVCIWVVGLAVVTPRIASMLAYAAVLSMGLGLGLLVISLYAKRAPYLMMLAPGYLLWAVAQFAMLTQHLRWAWGSGLILGDMLYVLWLVMAFRR